MPKQQKEYFTIDEVAALLDWDRTTVYAKMKLLGIQRVKFHGNRRSFLKREDIDRLRSLKEAPWKAGVEKSTETEASVA